MRGTMRRTMTAVLVCACSCSHPLAHPPYSPQPTDALVEVTAPPPPGRVETVPARPDPAAVWVDGEWTWRRHKWAWTPGRWLLAPSGATFSPWAFIRGADVRYWYAPGTWRDPKGAPLATAPAPLATAAVDASEVVNAVGEAQVVGPTVAPSASSASSGTPVPTRP